MAASSVPLPRLRAWRYTWERWWGGCPAPSRHRGEPGGACLGFSLGLRLALGGAPGADLRDARQQVPGRRRGRDVHEQGVWRVLGCGGGLVLLLRFVYRIVARTPDRRLLRGRPPRVGKGRHVPAESGDVGVRCRIQQRGPPGKRAGAAPPERLRRLAAARGRSRLRPAYERR